MGLELCFNLNDVKDSLNISTTLGPLASVLANKYGCKAVTIAGAMIAASGFLLCTFSPNIEIMILTYGIMGGMYLYHKWY